MRTATAILIGAGALGVGAVFLLSRQSQAAQLAAQQAAGQAAMKSSSSTRTAQEIGAWAAAINQILGGAFGIVDKVVGYVDDYGATGAYAEPGGPSGGGIGGTAPANDLAPSGGTWFD